VTLGNHNGTDGQTDRQTDIHTDRVRRNMRPPPREEGRIITDQTSCLEPHHCRYAETMNRHSPLWYNVSAQTKNLLPSQACANSIKWIVADVHHLLTARGYTLSSHRARSLLHLSFWYAVHLLLCIIEMHTHVVMCTALYVRPVRPAENVCDTPRPW